MGRRNPKKSLLDAQTFFLAILPPKDQFKRQTRGFWPISIFVVPPLKGRHRNNAIFSFRLDHLAQAFLEQFGWPQAILRSRKCFKKIRELSQKWPISAVLDCF